MKILEKPAERAALGVIPVFLYLDSEYCVLILTMTVLLYWVLQLLLMAGSMKYEKKYLEVGYFICIGILLASWSFVGKVPYWILSLFFMTTFPKEKSTDVFLYAFSRGYKQVFYGGVLFLVWGLLLFFVYSGLLIYQGQPQYSILIQTVFFWWIILMVSGHVFRKRFA